MAREKRRDEIRAASPEVLPAPRRRKDTRRWCRGKVGVEHVLEHREEGKGCTTIPFWSHPHGAVSTSETMVVCREVDVCVNCGKRFPLYGDGCRLSGSNDQDGHVHPYQAARGSAP
jgi:hypothetical protein